MFVCSISTDVLLPCIFFFDEVLANYSCHCIFRPSAEQALAVLQGTLIGGQNVRLSWGRSLSNKQVQIKRNIVIFLSIKLYNGAKVDNIVVFECLQPQHDSNQWGAGAGAGGYYGGYGQGYETYGGYAQPQDPNMYGYGAYAGYPNYQQQQVAQQQPPQQVRLPLLVSDVI